MNKQRDEKLDYGNWVSKKLIYMPAIVALFLLALSVVSYLFILVALFFLTISVYFAYAYYKFSQSGGDLQGKIRQLVLDRLIWDGEGRALDIGCGNGALVVKLAKKYPNAQITGIDYWGGKWGYSKETCEKNAEIEGVADRTSFQKASAASLPFEDESFEAAINNFVFHEVSEFRDKRSAVREALRVVKKGGVFVFQDLFLDKKLYGEINNLLETISGWGIQNVKFINTNTMEYIPKPLKPKFMLGAIGIIYGKK